MLRWRLLLGFWIVLSIIGLCWLDLYLENLTTIPGMVLFPLLILLIALACREMLHLANRNHVFPVPYITYLSCFLIASSSWGMFVFQHYSNQPGTSNSAAEYVSDSNPDSNPDSNSVSTPVLRQTRDDSKSPNAAPPEGNRVKLLQKLEHLTPGNWALSAFALSVILVFLQEMYTFVRPGAINIRISYTIFTIVYVGLLPTFLAQIRLCHGLPALLMFVAVIKMGDIGAYTVGRLIGRNKMAPSLSPGKTIEGACGAILFSVMTSLAFFFWVMPFLGKECDMHYFGWWLFYGAALGLLGMLGDLAESLLKRDAEIKDAGTLVPGFGGVLDILDSLILPAPVAYAFLTLNLLYN